jgi:chromate transporter
MDVAQRWAGMNLLLLYFLLLKATLTSFNGPTSLPVVHADLVENRRVLTDRQLNTAMAAGRSGPGPAGIYVIGVGYLVAGVPGAIVGWLAMVTPAFLIIPLLRFLGARAEQPVVRRITEAVTLAGAGLMLSTIPPLARDALTGPLPGVIAVLSALILALTRIDTIWVIAGAVATGLVAALI